MRAREDIAGETRAGWVASLELHFAARARGTFLADRRHSGPLIVQRPFWPEGPVCHTYIVHPPGGVVGGDRLELRVHGAAGSHALITTPAAGKFYRSAGRVASQRQEISLNAASLEWLPQESILYPQASVRLATCVRLCAQSRFIGWDIVCYGRPASGLAYSEGQVAQDFELYVDGAAVVLDRLRLDGASDAMRAAYGLAGHPVLATLFAYPADQSVLEAARTVDGEGITFASTRVGNVLVCRAVGHHADGVRRVMENIWARVRPRIMGRTAVAPRIWAT